jgi:hypothetical protein
VAVAARKRRMRGRGRVEAGGMAPGVAGRLVGWVGFPLGFGCQCVEFDWFYVRYGQMQMHLRTNKVRW